ASEIEVARLVAKGLSYKEIARIRRRSFSTIDHQLRSIRQKTGASSTSALVSLLARTDFPQA
ncbi:helix-turn-helix domain-containing protein, partial [Pseudomonas aeruginosa]|nr:helix-turn-helix domain-containing protein [Pseudomonas aeruginosa]